jgi:hypothetical protein
MKYRKTSKTFTKEEATNKIQSTQMMIETLQEAIDTWKTQAITGIVLCVILAEFGSIEKAIEVNQKKIEWCNERINDLKRFV